MPSGDRVSQRNTNNPVTRHFLSAFVRLHILYHTAKGPIYGAEITEELLRHGYHISQGTLYPTLHMLEKQGYMTSREELVLGRRRKYYEATAAGRKVLAVARKRLMELVSEVVEDQDEAFQKIKEKHRTRGR